MNLVRAKMTTIAANKDKMVSDSKVTWETKSEDHTYSAQKLFLHPKTGDIIGAAGDNNHIEAFLAWYGTRKKKPEFGANADFEAIVLTTKGDIWVYDETLSRDKIKGDFYAVGSGGNAALGALYMGATLEQAVEIACKVDPHSGPPTQVLARQQHTGE